MAYGTTNSVFRLFVRWLFLISAGSIAVVIVPCVVLVALDKFMDLDNVAWVFQDSSTQLLSVLVFGGFIGFFTSIILAKFVQCKRCYEPALVIPDDSEGGNIFQPWRRKCIRCETNLAQCSSCD